MVKDKRFIKVLNYDNMDELGGIRIKTKIKLGRGEHLIIIKMVIIIIPKSGRHSMEEDMYTRKCCTLCSERPVDWAWVGLIIMAWPLFAVTI